MTKSRIVSHSKLRDEMMAVARGERPAPSDAGERSFESVEALMRLLTPETAAAMQEARTGGLPAFQSVDDLMADLKAPD